MLILLFQVSSFRFPKATTLKYKNTKTHCFYLECTGLPVR